MLLVGLAIFPVNYDDFEVVHVVQLFVLLVEVLLDFGEFLVGKPELAVHLDCLLELALCLLEAAVQHVFMVRDELRSLHAPRQPPRLVALRLRDLWPPRLNLMIIGTRVSNRCPCTIPLQGIGSR